MQYPVQGVVVQSSELAEGVGALQHSLPDLRGTARTVKPGTVILHSRADEVVPFADSEELVRNSGLPASALVEVGNDHRLADPEPLGAMLRACERPE